MILVYRHDWASTNFWNGIPVQLATSLNPLESIKQDQSSAINISFARVDLDNKNIICQINKNQIVCFYIWRAYEAAVFLNEVA